MDLRIRQLPEEEVRDTELPAGAHDELERRQPLGPEAVFDRLGVDRVRGEAGPRASPPPGGDLPPAPPAARAGHRPVPVRRPVSGGGPPPAPPAPGGTGRR